MCRHTCTNCRADMNQREAETHECPPAPDTYAPTAAEVEAGARALFIATMGGDAFAGDAWDEQPDDAPRKVWHRDLTRAALIAAHEAAQ